MSSSSAGGSRWRRTPDLPLAPSTIAAHLNRRGDAIAVVAADGLPGADVMVRPAGGAWSAPHRLTSARRVWLAAAVGPRGDYAAGVVPFEEGIAIAQTGAAAVGDALLVSTRARDAAVWSAPQAVLATQPLRAFPSVAVDEEGGVLAAVNRWVWDPRNIEILEARMRPAGAAAWEPVGEVAREYPEGGDDVVAMRLVMTGGHAFVGWSRVGHGGLDERWMSRLARGGGWTPLVRPGPGRADYSVAPNGRAIAVVDPREDWQRGSNRWRLRVVDVPYR